MGDNGEESKEISNPRGIFLPNGKPIITTPSPEQIALINADPRVEYFSTLGQQPKIEAGWMSNLGIHHIPGLLDRAVKKERYYRQKYIAHPLWDKISSDFGIEPENLAIRGTAVSIDSPVKTKSRGIVRSLSQILNEGTDTGSGQTRLASFSRKVTDKSPILYGRDHSEGYLTTWANVFRQDVEKPGDDRLIYPALLVYDTSNMVINYGDVTLPEDPKLRSKAIVKAYVLDNLHGENAKKLF